PPALHSFPTRRSSALHLRQSLLRQIMIPTLQAARFSGSNITFLSALLSKAPRIFNVVIYGVLYNSVRLVANVCKQKAIRIGSIVTIKCTRKCYVTDKIQFI